MKRIYQSICLLFFAIVSFRCQKELSGVYTNGTVAGNQPAPIISTLQGNVLDENGQPASGVQISVGAKSATTNAQGYFRIAGASLDKNTSLVRATQPGYFTAYRSFKATTGVNQVVVQLIKKTLAGTVDASSGGMASLPNGAKVSLAAGGIFTASGTPFSGSVQVYAAYIDPTSKEIGKTIPGSLMADNKDNKRVVLSSFGMLAVELESASGEKLQIAPGKTAALTIPIPSNIVSSAPASISLWYIDEQTGVWKEQGSAQKAGSNYLGEVKHFTYWNCDMGLPAVTFSAIFKTAENAPLKNIYIVAKVLNNISDTATGSAEFVVGYTDSLGQVEGLIPSNVNLDLEVMDECYGIVFTKHIGSLSQNTELGTIIVPNSVSSLITLKGQLLSCSNTPLSNGFAIVYWNNFVNYVPADAAGRFSTQVINCSGAPQTFKILGVDAATQEQSDLITITGNSQVTDAGSITACGTSSAEFINYKLDGTDYTLLKSANDSLIAFSYDDSINVTGQVLIVSGSHSTTNQLNFQLTGDAAGVYPLSSLSVINYNDITLVKPFNVTLTTFPQNSGEFYEGNFSGSFTNSSTGSVTHTIDCKFRIRKY